MTDAITIYGAAGSGSTPVEATMRLIGLPYEVREAVTWEGPAESDKVAAVNPMRQVPAVVFPGGEVMTESAAILLRLTEMHPGAGLAPPVDDPRRAQFLRWMVFLPAAIYPMFWVRDVPSRLADTPEGEQAILSRTADRIADCWRMMDAQVDPGRYILGDDMTVLDIYVTVMSRWTPRRRRFHEVAPKMGEVVRRVDADPRLTAFWNERFPFEDGWEG